MSRSVEAGRAHPRVSVSGLCFPTLSAVDAIAEAAKLGVGRTSMTSGVLRESGVEAVVEACRLHAVEIATTTAQVRFDLTPGADVAEQQQRAREDIDQAAAVGATSVYTLTGPRVFADWDANIDAYGELASGVVDYATSKGVTIAIEPTSWLYSDLNFVHSFHDTLRLASRVGMKVCLDVFHVWTESELHTDIVKNIDLVSHVQISDMQRGARSLPCRALPGEGDVPIRAVTQWLLDAGYAGVFDLELSGPRIDELGHAEAASRAVAWMDSLLVELGA